MTTQDTDLHIKVQANAVAGVFFIALPALIGAFLLYAGIAEIGYGITGRAVGYLLIGLAGLIIAYRLYLYFYKPQFSVLQDRVVARRFLRPTRTLHFADTAGWRLEGQTVTHGYIMGRRRKLPTPLHIEHLVQTDHLGKENQLTLPRYAGGNAEALRRIEANSRKPIVRS